MPESYNLLQDNNPDKSTAEKAGLDVGLQSQSNEAQSTLQLAQNQDTVIDNIVKQATDTTQDEKQFLSELKQMDSRLELDVPVTSTNFAQTKLAKLFFLVSCVLAAVALMFYLGLFTKIDYITESQRRLISTQAEKVVNNYLLSSVAVDNIALNSSKMNFALKYEPADVNEHKAVLVENLGVLRENLLEANSNLTTNEALASEVLQKLNDQRSNYASLKVKEDDPAKVETFKNLEQLYLNAAKISRNSDLVTLLKTKSVADLTEADLLALSELVLVQSSESKIARVATVELSRVNWTKIFDEFQSIITEFDPNFDVFTKNEEYVIAFSSYVFNSTTGLISATGEVRTDNSQTFTLIANLMDKLEESPVFKDLNRTTFTKSYSEDSATFTSGLNLTFMLEARELINGQST